LGENKNSFLVVVIYVSIIEVGKSKTLIYPSAGEKKLGEKALQGSTT